MTKNIRVIIVSSILILLIGFNIGSSISDKEYENEFVKWMIKFNKTYSNEEFQVRFNQFKETLEFINIYQNENLNSTFQIELNEFSVSNENEKKSMFGAIFLNGSSTITFENIEKLYQREKNPNLLSPIGGDNNSILNLVPRDENTYTRKPTPTPTPTPTIEKKEETLPDSIDWRDINGTSYVTTPKDQTGCSSCYAFAAIGLIESALLIRGKGTYDLSEQQLVDCTYHKYTESCNLGCKGGDISITLKHAITYGLVNEKEYTYTSGTSKTNSYCKRQWGTIKLTALTVYEINSGNEDSLAQALNNYGPVIVALNGENNDFYSYKSGIYNNPNCSNQTNHVLLLVGYGVEKDIPYWILKNSWSSSWGENGYMRIARGYNRCGIVTQSSYILN